MRMPQRSLKDSAVLSGSAEPPERYRARLMRSALAVGSLARPPYRPGVPPETDRTPLTGTAMFPMGPTDCAVRVIRSAESGPPVAVEPVKGSGPWAATGCRKTSPLGRVSPAPSRAGA